VSTVGARPTEPGAPPPRRRNLVIHVAGLVVVLVLAGVVSFYASAEPDGLERVAEDHGFADTADDHALDGSPVAGYEVRGVDDERLSVGLAGAAGALVTLVVVGALLAVLRARRQRPPAAGH
jgi:hypothetical protein